MRKGADREIGLQGKGKSENAAAHATGTPEGENDCAACSGDTHCGIRITFQYGYNVSVITSPAPFMQQFYNETYQGRYSKYMDESLMTALWSLSVSFFPLGGFFGSLMVGPM
ncbi:LOW QUALITY PROTEIN: solute carrier family 2, facilitated glucose transporter member 5-like [Thamnophis elegans]|uniref:LOW QUALITY PROTEIN: solute carrier family 2, facilitated glucose transporter member 5-like n=1 Tax=Thamnophis elegans TaxID=35005 RepID=UPI001377B7C0|nr:LOW QUALITY PROTEIN: solute carrier family 2, facilitated glucose transporter member 5-like [Thamnophis elegans]